ncbi:MAG: hypothetical protein QNJ55_30440 [Xenococcus sp. MO_188.B8]|nr:hypothetical protein [Xenococcus sp. MO_188.B8]
MGKLRTAALVFDSIGFVGSCALKLNAVRTGNTAQSEQADKLIEKGIKNLKRDIGL